MHELGHLVAQRIMLRKREELADYGYYPIYPHIKKWAHETSSAYIGDQKVSVKCSRIRDMGPREVSLKSYAGIHAFWDFSEELLGKISRGVFA